MLASLSEEIVLRLEHAESDSRRWSVSHVGMLPGQLAYPNGPNQPWQTGRWQMWEPDCHHVFILSFFKRWNSMTASTWAKWNVVSSYLVILINTDWQAIWRCSLKTKQKRLFFPMSVVFNRISLIIILIVLNASHNVAHMDTSETLVLVFFLTNF